MKMDRVFVLMLVVMLPMTGCFEDTVGDAEGSEGDGETTTVINNYYNNATEYNHPPVISASLLGTPEYTDTNCITDGVQFQVQHAMMDWDGNIVQAGWDVNLDGSIDHYVTNTQDNIIVQIPLNSMSAKNDTVPEYGGLFGGITGEIEQVFLYQYVVFGAQDDSGEWTSSELFLIEKLQSETTSSGYTTNYTRSTPCSEGESSNDGGLDAYTFAGRDAGDTMSPDGGDDLVHVQMTQGDALSWAVVKISIVVDDGALQNCVEAAAADGTEACSWAKDGDSTWAASEEITISEGADNNLCGETSAGCDVDVTITKIGVGGEDDKIIATVSAYADTN